MKNILTEYGTSVQYPIFFALVNQFKYYFLGSNGVELLSAPALPVASSEAAGDLIANAVTGLLRKWNCTDKIASMVFNTTAANTGM